MSRRGAVDGATRTENRATCAAATSSLRRRQRRTACWRHVLGSARRCDQRLICCPTGPMAPSAWLRCRRATCMCGTSARPRARPGGAARRHRSHRRRDGSRWLVAAGHVGRRLGRRQRCGLRRFPHPLRLRCQDAGGARGDLRRAGSGGRAADRDRPRPAESTSRRRQPAPGSWAGCSLMPPR